MPSLAERRKDLVASMMREGIYEAAVAVLTRHGLEGMTMDKVAQEAGVAKGSLYNYFPNKQVLLQFVHTKAIEPVQQKTADVLAMELSAPKKLDAMLRMWFDHLDAHRGLFNFLHDHTVRSLLKSEEETCHESVVRDLSAVIEQGISEGSFRRVDPTRVAELIFGAVRQVAEPQLAVEGAWPIDEMAVQMMDFFLHGLGKQGGSHVSSVKETG